MAVHKLNNALAQCSLAKYMGVKNIIAETGLASTV